MPKVLAILADSTSGRARLLACIEQSCEDFQVVSRSSEAEQAVRAAPVDGIVFDSEALTHDCVARLRRDHPTKAFVAWLGGPSSLAVAELLEAGADEVVHGGMGEREIVARLSGTLRQGGKPLGRGLELGSLVLDSLHGEASWRGEDLKLTPRERALLQVLAEQAGRTVRREVIYTQVWGYSMARGERSVDVNIKRLRRKLAAVTGHDLQVRTQAGVGYRLELAPEPTRDAVTAL